MASTEYYSYLTWRLQVYCVLSLKWKGAPSDLFIHDNAFMLSLSDLELKPTGILEVKLVQAKGLTNKDLIGKSDPYAVLFIRPLRDRTKTSKVIVSEKTDFTFYKTFLHLTLHSLQNNDLDPIWNEHFEFTVEDASTQKLTVKIYDDEGLQASELIGCTQVRLQDLQPGKVKDVWLRLVKDLEVQRDTKDRGQVSVQFSC